MAIVAVSVVCAFGSICSAQTQSAPPIQVKTREVVVPVFVFNQTGTGGDSEVRGLTAKDFRIYEDGKEQKILGINTEQLQDWWVQDNISVHTEHSCTPTGYWKGPDIPQFPFFTARFTQQSELHVYLVSYEPPPSAEGSCHRLKVKLKKWPSPTVYARDEYCGSANSLSDPLAGTKLGARIRGYTDGPQLERLSLSAQTSWLFGASEQNIINIAAEFPWHSLERRWVGDRLFTTIGVLGEIYSKTGVLVTRFSDTPCRFAGSKPWDWCDHCVRDNSWTEYNIIPDGYITQTKLPPGEFNLRVVVADGDKYGQIEIPLKVDSYDRDKIAISGIVLCKRYHAALPRANQYNRLISKIYEYTPAADNRFQKNEPLIAFFEVREPLLGENKEVHVEFELRVVDASTGEVKIDTGVRPAESWIQPGNAIISIAEGVVLDRLAPNKYRVEILASDSSGNKTEWGSTSFTVE